MRVFITGGTGFIGRHLVHELVDDGHEVVILSRRPGKVADAFGRGVMGLAWNGTNSHSWLDAVNGDTAIVNLAGENIAARWSRQKKTRILESRLKAGQAVLEAIERAPKRPKVLIQASAVGFYGPQQGPQQGSQATPLTESDPRGQGFLARVCEEWEASTRPVEDLGVRRVVIRTGVVLGPGGALSRMLPPFRFFLGGPLGSGNQGLSWIHLHDETWAIRSLLADQEAHGVYNLCAPNPVSNKAFSKALGQALHRPSWLPVPGAALRLLYGEMAQEALLSGQYALPQRLMDQGFSFRFPELGPALADLV